MHDAGPLARTRDTLVRLLHTASDLLPVLPNDLHQRQQLLRAFRPGPLFGLPHRKYAGSARGASCA